MKRHRRGSLAPALFVAAGISYNNNKQSEEGGQGGVNGDGQACVGLTEMVESLTVKLGPQVNTQCAFL